MPRLGPSASCRSTRFAAAVVPLAFGGTFLSDSKFPLKSKGSGKPKHWSTGDAS